MRPKKRIPTWCIWDRYRIDFSCVGSPARKRGHSNFIHHCARIAPTKCRQKSPLTWQNIGDNPRALSLANRIKQAGELLGRSGLQLPRVPSLNTDRADFTEAAVRGYRLGYQRQ